MTSKTSSSASGARLGFVVGVGSRSSSRLQSMRFASSTPPQDLVFDDASIERLQQRFFEIAQRDRSSAEFGGEYAARADARADLEHAFPANRPSARRESFAQRSRCVPQSRPDPVRERRLQHAHLDTVKRARLISLHRPDRALARGDGDRSRVSCARSSAPASPNASTASSRSRATLPRRTRDRRRSRRSSLDTRARISRVEPAPAPAPRPRSRSAHFRRRFGSPILCSTATARSASTSACTRSAATTAAIHSPADASELASERASTSGIARRANGECRPECAFDRHFDARGEVERRDVDQRARERR